MIDKVEKLARAAFWLALAAGCVLVVFGFARWQHESSAAAGSLARASASKPNDVTPSINDGPRINRLTFESMGRAMRALDTSHATGELWFTNVSPREGVVCVVGVARNESTQQTSESLASCENVKPYASVHMSVMFAGATIGEMCKGVRCVLDMRDEPDAKL
jgi:hypothetical protein